MTTISKTLICSLTIALACGFAAVASAQCHGGGYYGSSYGYNCPSTPSYAGYDDAYLQRVYVLLDGNPQLAAQHAALYGQLKLKFAPAIQPAVAAAGPVGPAIAPTPRVAPAGPIAPAFNGPAAPAFNGPAGPPAPAIGAPSGPALTVTPEAPAAPTFQTNAEIIPEAPPAPPAPTL